ncbi:hypothetical protein AB5I39_13255 [Sphingomonas sp. MMS24-J45]|uniref:hypothetical protein n=1 Tax=Sphingomonas sp. MMS24-J45 TaxID=3238806 RepID=UPI00384A8EEF
MSFATLTDIVTMLFCTAVLVQSVRLIRALRAMKGDDFGAMVKALDKATAEAREVLDELRETLRVDCAANARVIATGTAMREELTVMAGIADAVAERIVEAVEKSKTMPNRTTDRPSAENKARAKPRPRATSTAATAEAAA